MIQTESDMEKQISRMIPAQIRGTETEEIEVRLAVDECIKELNSFYKLQESGGKFFVVVFL